MLKGASIPPPSHIPYIGTVSNKPTSKMIWFNYYWDRLLKFTWYIFIGPITLSHFLLKCTIKTVGLYGPSRIPTSMYVTRCYQSCFLNPPESGNMLTISIKFKLGEEHASSFIHCVCVCPFPRLSALHCTFH